MLPHLTFKCLLRIELRCLCLHGKNFTDWTSPLQLFKASPSFLSAVVINSIIKDKLEMEIIPQLTLSGSNWRETMEETRAWTIKESVYWLTRSGLWPPALLYFLESFSHSVKHSQWARPSSSINNQDSSSQAWLQINVIWMLLQLTLSFPSDLWFYQVYKEN